MRKGAVWKRIGLGALGAFLAVVISAALFALLMDREVLGLEYLNVCAAASLILGGIAAGLSGGRGAERWAGSAAAAAGLLLLLLAVNLMGYDGALKGAVPCCILILGSTAGTTLAMGGRKREKRRKYQIKKYRTG